MLLIQLTGLSGSGKTTIARKVKEKLIGLGFRTELLDGDVYRNELWPELTYSKQDRIKNIERLSFIANILKDNGVIVIIAAINPYEYARESIKDKINQTMIVYISCDLDTLFRRDTKGLYARAKLPDNHPNKIYNLTGINDVYEVPKFPDLTIETNTETEEQSANKLLNFVINHIY